MPSPTSGLAATDEYSPGDIAQTLDRGLAVLDTLLANPQGLTINEISEALGVARSIARRLVATLARRHLVSEVSRGRFQLGAKLVELGAGVQPQLLAISEPILHETARAAGATAVLSVAEGDSAVSLASVAPPEDIIHVVWRVGAKFPLNRGASGIAMLSLGTAVDGELDEVGRCRERGWALSADQIQKSISAVASPVHTHWPITAAVGLVVAGPIDSVRLGPLAAHAAERIALLLNRKLGM